ncbi:hypothetical protein RYX36_020399, partial [Vicia faba]
MAAITSSFSFSTPTQSTSQGNSQFFSTRFLCSESDVVRFRFSLSSHCVGIRTSNSVSKLVVRCSSSVSNPLPTVSKTKSIFFKAYKRPISSIYNSVLQELIVQQHLMRYKKSYRYDPILHLALLLYLISSRTDLFEEDPDPATTLSAPMAAVTPSFSFLTPTQSPSQGNSQFFSTRFLSSESDAVRFRFSLSSHCVGIRTSNSFSKLVVRCSSSISKPLPTVSNTKSIFLKAYKRPISSIYNSVLQELIVQQHLMIYKKSYRYDPVLHLALLL